VRLHWRACTKPELFEWRFVRLPHVGAVCAMFWLTCDVAGSCIVSVGALMYGCCQVARVLREFS